jgi:serine phosphatase RsbU (regulator of sigma subunit)
MSIRVKLILTYLLVSLPLVVLLAASFYGLYRERINAAISERTEIARLTSSSFNLFLEQTLNNAFVVGTAIVNQGLSREHATALLQSIARREFAPSIIGNRPSAIANAAFLNPQGVVLAASATETVGQNLSNESAVHAIMQGKDSAISNLQRNPGGSIGFVITMAVMQPPPARGQITSGGNRPPIPAGIIGFFIDASKLRNVLDVSVASGGVNIVDASGHLIYHSQLGNAPLSARDWGNQPFVKAALSGKTYTSAGVPLPNGLGTRLGAEIPIKNIGWAAGAFVPVNTVLAPIQRDALLSALLTLAILFIAVLFAFVLGNTFADNLIALKEEMVEAPQEGFSHRIDMKTGDEIEALARSFNQMQDEIVAAQQEQQRLQQQLQERNIELGSLYEAQRNVASILQENLLPKIVRRVDNLEVGLKFQSATEAALIGGDFYDFFEISPDRYGVIIGDVSGKGIEAAALASTIRNTLRAFAYNENSPGRALQKTNNIAIIETEPSIFVTLFYGIFDTARNILTYANAGHWPPLMCRAQDNAFEELKTGGIALGIVDNPEYADYAVELAPRSLAVLFTDGIIEARGADGSFLGITGLREVVRDEASLPAIDIASHIIDRTRSFSGGKLLDDAAALVIKIG